MPFFFSFLFFLLGLLSGIYSPWILLVSLIPFTYLLLYRKDKKTVLIGLLFLLIGFFLIFLYPKGNSDAKELIGICIYRKSNYYFLLTLNGKYQVSDKEGVVKLFSIVKLTGSASLPFETHYEGSFDYNCYLKSQGIFYSFFAKKTDIILDSHYDLGYLKNYVFSYLNSSEESFASSLLFGESLTDSNSSYALQELSLSSALSLSGFHLSFLILILRTLFKKKMKEKFFYLEISVLLVFLCLSGFKYTIRRIFLLTILSFWNQNRKERLNGVEVLSILSLLMLGLEPYSLISPAFYYPFPLLFLLRFFPNRSKSRKDKIFFSVLIIAFFLPIRLLERSSLLLFGPLAQLILLPFSHLLFLGSLICFIIPQNGIVLSILIKAFFKIVTFTQSTSPVLLSGNILIGFLVIYYLLLVLALVFKNYHFKRPAMFSALGIPLILLISFCPDYFDYYEVTFIDVGQGDSTLIRNGKSNILIDTGGSTKTDLGTNCLVPYLRKRKIRKLDAVLITHLDYDHYGALESLKNHFQVDQVIYGNDFADFEDHSYVLGNLKIKNLNLYNISTDTNDQSGVFSFSIKDTSFLIEGDAPINIEKKILKDNPDIKVDYLKLGHHGSKTSSCFEYLKALEPKIAIISCGLNNQYGHPDKEVIARLEKLNIEYHRTDYEKTITYCV